MRTFWRVKCPWCDQLIVGDWKIALEDGGAKSKVFKARRHTKQIRPGFRYTHNQMVCVGARKLYAENHPALVPPDAT